MRPPDRERTGPLQGPARHEIAHHGDAHTVARSGDARGDRSPFARRPRRNVSRAPVPAATAVPHPHDYDRHGFCRWCGEHGDYLADRARSTAPKQPAYEYSPFGAPWQRGQQAVRSQPGTPTDPDAEYVDDWLAAVIADEPPDVRASR